MLGCWSNVGMWGWMIMVGYGLFRERDGIKGIGADENIDVIRYYGWLFLMLCGV